MTPTKKQSYKEMVLLFEEGIEQLKEDLQRVETNQGRTALLSALDNYETLRQHYQNLLN